MVKLIHKIADAVLAFLHLSKFKEQIMYLGVGVLTTVVDWIVYTVFVLFVPSVGGDFLKAISPNILSYTIAWFSAVIFSYFASRALVFKPTDEKISTQFMKFFGSRALTLALSIVGDILLSGNYRLIDIENPFIAKLIISVAIIIINYITSKWLVFTKKSPNGK
ncbi:MAG: GtrA family protein [Clostridia bacterium]|nr:GtrA family protein [Clostridia bacterium]